MGYPSGARRFLSELASQHVVCKPLGHACRFRVWCGCQVA